ncbi:MAG: RsmE family RNA methyltransferase [Silvanigrellaceae bacterium]|nr:RsmE family RNA methyltransferase [Silvanigrellaceae bacterium]
MNFVSKKHDREKQAWMIIAPELKEHDTEILLSEEEHHYVSHVLRLKLGMEVDVCNLKGLSGKATVIECKKNFTTLNILNTFYHTKTKPTLKMFIGLTKISTLEDIVSQVSELGCDELHIFPTEKCVHKGTLKLEKLNKISAESVRISKNPYATKIFAYHSLSDFLAHVKQDEPQLVLFCDEKISELSACSFILPTLQQKVEKNCCAIGILVGPEASFSPQERSEILQKLNPHCVSLGSSILKVQNAVLSSLSIVLEFVRTRYTAQQKHS